MGIAINNTFCSKHLISDHIMLNSIIMIVISNSSQLLCVLNRCFGFIPEVILNVERHILGTIMGEKRTLHCNNIDDLLIKMLRLCVCVVFPIQVPSYILPKLLQYLYMFTCAFTDIRSRLSNPVYRVLMIYIQNTAIPIIGLWSSFLIIYQHSQNCT